MRTTHGWKGATMIVPFDPPLSGREQQYQIALSQERIDHFHTKRKLVALEQERDRLRTLGAECADDLESEVRAQHGWPHVHPAVLHKFDRDMVPVLAFRAALNKEGGDDE